MKIVKAILLMSAALVVILRLFSHENAAFLSPEQIDLMNIISIVSAAVCVICAVIWIISIKKNEKKENEEDSDS